MLIPRRNDFDIFDDMFRDPFFSKKESNLMKTDIKELDSKYEITMDLPGYEKDDIKISVEDGYLTVEASRNTDNEEKEEGKFVRKERYFGQCSRSFYVGDEVETKDINASFKNGTLCLDVPKNNDKKELPKKEYVQITD